MNDNDEPVIPAPDNVTSIADFRAGKREKKDNTLTSDQFPPPEAKPQAPSKYEFHFFPTDDEGSGEEVTVEGYITFGPQFIAVLEDKSNLDRIKFACSSGIVKYVKRLDAEGTVQGTLSL